MRIARFDGLRGIAALMVVFSHLAAGFRPQMYFGIEKTGVENTQTLFATSPFFVLINGSFAVYVFFVLSGFVISASADKFRSPILTTIVARYIRLSITPAISILFAAAIINFGIPSGTATSQLVGHWWVKDWPRLDTHQPWNVALKDAVGWYYVTGSSYFNGVVWTMQKELYGSVCIFIVFHFFTRLSARLALGICIAIAVVHFDFTPYYYLCFVAGTFMYLARSIIEKFPARVGVTAFFFGVLLGGKPFFAPPTGSFYDWPYRVFALAQNEIYMWPLGAVLLVLGALIWSRSEAFLGSRFARFLGRVSFAVYLLHFPILVALMTNLFVRWGHSSNIAFGATSVVYVLAVYGCGYVATLLIDEPSIKFSRWIKQLKGEGGRQPQESGTGSVVS